MQSLRTRKPSEARPRGQRPTNKLARPGVVSRRATRVDDKIRKRMSTRYADISSPTDVSIPAVPTVPLALRAGGIAPRSVDPATREQEQANKEEQREAELRMLDKEDFDPDAFLKLKMANSTEAELRQLRTSLTESKDEVALDLKRNVFKNYTEFMLVSKEVSSLENEMLEFKEALAEWKAMPSTLHIDDSASVSERRRNVRSSIADLRALYANQMQNLHTQIEGSSKFIPTTPGRHVILEMDGVSALNPATFKVDHSVRFVLLDDALLVARRRRRRNMSESDKLIAERCWNLNDVLVLDTKDTPSMTNVFKIRSNKETHVYRTEVAAEKKHLLAQFRQVAEELQARRRKEREGEHQRRKSLWMAGGRTSQAFPPDVPPLPDFLADIAEKADLGASVKEKSERDTRLIDEFSDELTVSIALRKWDHAVMLVEEGEAKLATLSGLGVKLTPLKASLITALLQSLSMPNNRKSTAVKLITLLIRLKAGVAARSTFLAARSGVMKKRIRMITFEGHIGMYISDLAMVVFTGIKHTADWFLASFKENEVSSSFIEWARDQMMNYAGMFRKQVYSSDVDLHTVQDAIKITYLQSKRLLEEYGLDFRFLLEKLLVEKPCDPKLAPPSYPSHRTTIAPDPIRTPASTPVRSRSPVAPIAAPIPTRIRSPALSPTRTTASGSSSPSITQRGSSPASSSPAVSPVPPPAPAPRVRSPALPVPSAASSIRPSTPSEASVTRMGIGPGGPRPLRGSPAPPPRSRDRPSSPANLVRSRGDRPASPAPPPRSSARPGSAIGNRPAPVAVPKREGMF